MLDLYYLKGVQKMRNKNENKSVGNGFEIKEGSVNYKETEEK